MIPLIRAILEVWVGINDERRLRLSLDQIRPLAEIYHPCARVYDAYSAMLPTIHHKSRRLRQPSIKRIILPALISRAEEDRSPGQPPADGSVQLHTQASTQYSSLQASPYISPTVSGSPTSTTLSSLPYSSPTSEAPLRSSLPSGDLPPGLRDRSLPRQLASRSNLARDMEELVGNLLDDNITST